MQHDGWLETLFQSELTGQNVSFRNMSLSGDRPNNYPRSKGFLEMDEYLRHVKADVVFAMFGYNESFAGQKGANPFKAQLIDFVTKIRCIQPNGKTFQGCFVLSDRVSGSENRNLPRGKVHNRNLALYAEATADAARQAGVQFVDLFNPTLALFQQSSEPLTINGAHLNEEGNRRLLRLSQGTFEQRDECRESLKV